MAATMFFEWTLPFSQNRSSFPCSCWLALLIITAKNLGQIFMALFMCEKLLGPPARGIWLALQLKKIVLEKVF